MEPAGALAAGRGALLLVAVILPAAIAYRRRANAR
jgi:hypothetical protein